MTAKENEIVFSDALRQLDRAFEFAGIDSEVLERLKYPRASIQVSIPVRMDDGSLRVFEGYRVRYDDSRGPGKGGKELEVRRDWQPQEMRVAVQGFGNAGQHVAQLLHNDGYKIVAVSDSQGAIYQPDGFDVPSLAYRKNKSRRLEAVYCDGSVCESVQAERLSKGELLELDVDLLIPAALENQITAENAHQIKAPVIVEVANGPTTSEADEILNGKGTLIVPDILANAGGVTVSYFEWEQNKAGYYWPVEEVHSKLHTIMVREFDNVYELMTDRELDMRTAAYALALRRIGEAISAHGTGRYFSGDDV